MRRALLNSAREKRAVPHPRDRSVRQLEKKEKRAIRLDAQKSRLQTEQTLHLMRFFWFREQCIALGYTATAVPEDTITSLVHLYVARNDDEVAALKTERNPPLGRIKVLEASRQLELDELQSAKGLRVPCLTDADDVEILADIWDGSKDTVKVVTAVGFSMQSRTPPTKAALVELSQRLRPVTEIREEAPLPLPRRAVRFHAAQKTSSAGGGVATRKNVSVKKTEDSLSGVKSRAKAREEAKRQKRLKTQRSAAMASHRS